MARNGYHTDDHDEMQHLCERLAKVEALRDGASTPGERHAADAAARRLKDRISQSAPEDRGPWFPFSSLEELPEDLRTMIRIVGSHVKDGGELYFVGSAQQGTLTYRVSSTPIAEENASDNSNSSSIDGRLVKIIGALGRCQVVGEISQICGGLVYFSEPGSDIAP